MIDIDELDRMYAAATPGQAEAVLDDRIVRVRVAGYPYADIVKYASVEADLADAKLIAALHNAWPAISRELRALREVAEHLAEVQREIDFREATSQHDNYTDQARSRQREFEAFSKALAAAKAAREVRDG